MKEDLTRAAADLMSLAEARSINIEVELSTRDEAVEHLVRLATAYAKDDQETILALPSPLVLSNEDYENYNQIVEDAYLRLAVSSVENFTEFLDGIKPEEVKSKRYLTFDLPSAFMYKRLSIEFTNNGGVSQQEIGFQWGLERNFFVTGSTGWYFPVKSRYVTTFKTFQGMKRSLVNALKAGIARFGSK